MTTTTTIDAPPLTHDQAMALQREELARALRLLESLEPHDWRAQTECPDWDVRRMYLHVLGACEGAGTREMVHQLRAARRRQRATGGPLEAALSAVQVEERIDLTPDQLVARLRDAAPVTIRRRTKLPGLLRHQARMKVDGPVVETWRLGYLVDTIYLRDLWLHRIDACRAVGREPELTADHDGRIVADVVDEWARRHGQPYALELSGPAGGRFTAGDGAQPVVIDAVEFCRTLGGRAPGTGLLATVVPF